MAHFIPIIYDSLRFRGGTLFVLRSSLLGKAAKAKQASYSGRDECDRFFVYVPERLISQIRLTGSCTQARRIVAVPFFVTDISKPSEYLTVSCLGAIIAKQSLVLVVLLSVGIGALGFFLSDAIIRLAGATESVSYRRMDRPGGGGLFAWDRAGNWLRGNVAGVAGRFHHTGNARGVAFSRRQVQDPQGMKIAIGSTNPTKVRAAKKILRKIYPQATFVALEVASGVPRQPRGDKQTRQGAVNRARAVRQATHADLGIGLEAGIIETEYGMMTCAWVAIVDRAGRVGIGGSTNMLLPDPVVRRLKQGSELGEAMDEFAHIADVKRKLGAIGVLTRGLSNRQRAYEEIIKLAVARFLWKEKYSRRVR